MELDEIDLDILRLLVEDARRPYNDIADRVDVSAPTVSDRVDRLRERGIIQRFTLDVDRTRFSDAVEVLIDLELRANVDDRVADRMGAVDEVDRVFHTAADRLIAVATVPPDGIRTLVDEAIDRELVRSHRIHLVEERVHEPTIGDGGLARSCDECDDAVTNGGVSARIDDDRYHFCSQACRSGFEERHAGVTEST